MRKLTQAEIDYDRQLQQSWIDNAKIQDEINKAPAIDKIVSAADEAHKEYPQYKGYYADPQWKLVQVKKTINTMMGPSFEKGDFCIGHPHREEGKWAIYSVRTSAEIILPMKQFKII